MLCRAPWVIEEDEALPLLKALPRIRASLARAKASPTLIGEAIVAKADGDHCDVRQCLNGISDSGDCRRQEKASSL